MKHKHEYEPVFHPTPSLKAKEIGIKAIEIRRCKTCQRELIFISSKGENFPLYEDKDTSEQDILMA
ncbi:MAG: hypothetical protein L0Y62_00365 [Nitrospirae bacterium]|nr:hypothetical protein [Nitrospirota bacterium]